MIPIITYTNNKCCDLWKMYIEQTRKFYGKSEILFITNSFIDFLLMDKTINFYYYSDNQNFCNSWLEALKNYKNEFFLYMQEDFILYDYVNHEILKEYLNLMTNNTNISCIRLIKSGIKSSVQAFPNLFWVDYSVDYAFSMQASIWRTSDFIKLQNLKIQKSPWDEGKLDGNILKKNNIKTLYHYMNERKRGENHYDSLVFPYIATALVKGKWNTKEYPELDEILKEYNINKKIRGEYTG